jgi:tetratricopeptide (TPR) repeat protein
VRNARVQTRWIAITGLAWLSATRLGHAAEPAPAKAAPSAEPTVSAFDSANAKANADADADAKAHARTVYERGARAYAEGRFAQAVDLFLEADRIFPTPLLRFNIAKAYDRVGHPSGALRYYRDYLSRAPDAADAQEVTARVRELELLLSQRGVQQLNVISDPENALVVLDGRPVGLTPWTGETWPGKHRLRLELSGHEPTEDVVELEPLHARDANYKLAEKAPAAPPKVLSAASDRDAPASVTPLTWVMLGVGTAALGTALFIEMANQEQQGLSRTGAFFAGAGLCASALGGVLLYVDLSGPGRSTRKVALLPNSVEVSLKKQF